MWDTVGDETFRTQVVREEVKRRVKKIPTLFVRDFNSSGEVVRIRPKVIKGMEWVASGDGVATEKVDGACCAIFGGRLYKRLTVRPWMKVPNGAIPCQSEPDAITGSFPHWVPVDRDVPADRWLWSAYINTPWASEDGTYEAVGVHFQGNPYHLDDDFLERHGRIRIIDCPRDYDGIKEYLRTHDIEGIVFWKDGEPRCKIRKKDFGMEWKGVSDE